MEAQRDDALNTIEQLLAQHSELQITLDKTLEDRHSWRNDYGLLATEKTILENKLARLESQPDLKARCLELESELDRSEESLERSKSLRRDEDSERKALSAKASRAEKDLVDVKTTLMLRLECLKVDHWEQLDLVTKQRDEARAALPTSSTTSSIQLRKELKAKNEKITLLRTTLKAQEAKLGARVTIQPLQIQQPKLDQQHLEEALVQVAASKKREEARNAEIKELRASVDSQAEAIRGNQTLIAELEETLKAREAIQKDHHELTSLVTTRDQANQTLLLTVSTANASRIEELERLLTAKEATHQDLRTKELENTGHQLAEIARLESAIAWTNADQATLREKHLAESNSQQAHWQGLLQAKDAELQRTKAQHLEEREAQRIKIKTFEDDQNVRENVMDVDVVPDHVCDHSRCMSQASLREGRITSLEGSLMARDVKFGRLQAETKEQGMKMMGLEAQLGDQKAVIEKLQLSVGSTSGSTNRDPEMSELRRTMSELKTKLEDRERQLSSLTATSKKATSLAVKATRDRLQQKEKELEVEKAGRQKAVEAERIIAQKRLESGEAMQGVQAKMRALKKELDEMTANRNACRAANEKFRIQSVNARETAEAGDLAQQQVESQRDELAKTVGQLQGRMGRMVEVESMEAAAGPSRKRQGDGEQDSRPAKIIRDD